MGHVLTGGMARLPNKQEILEWVADNPARTAKRDIARAFGVKGAARIELKRMLRDLEAEGALAKRAKSYRDPESLPPVSVLEVVGPDSDGDLTAKALEWNGKGVTPQITVAPRLSDPALGPGDRILARLSKSADGPEYEARLIRRIGVSARRIVGIFRSTAEGGRVVPIDKKSDAEWIVPAKQAQDAQDGELVEAEQTAPKSRIGLPVARIIERIGDPSAPKAVSLIAIHQHGIPDQFPGDVLAQADQSQPVTVAGREDLTDLPFVTIDPADARDHDDACYAQADGDGGYRLWVAIADVAAFVPPGSVLDKEALKRGNSTYFPDRVVPMLPDRLSGDLCSLHEGVDRAVVAVEMCIDAEGRKTNHRFCRAMLRSAASLTYEQAQAAVDGTPDEQTEPLLQRALQPLFGAYRALLRARDARQPLELDLPERQIVLSDAGKVQSVAFKQRLDAHKMIEEFMVLANVAAAETLISKRQPLLFRVHEEPTPEKLDALRETVQASGLMLAKGQVLQTGQINRLLRAAAETDDAELINMSTLRAMTQAYYSADNLGHFGLALRSYAHFTSPIRRYSDLVVHRALISAHGWGTDGLKEDTDLEHVGKHVSATERRSISAERDTTDRYLAAHLSDRVGAEFTGRISGVAKFGLFIALDETGADGLVPMRSIGNEYFLFDREKQTLFGSDTGLELRAGMTVTVRLAEASATTGGILLELLDVSGASLPRGAPRKRRGPPRGKRRPRKVTRKRRA